MQFAGADALLGEGQQLRGEGHEQEPVVALLRGAEEGFQVEVADPAFEAEVQELDQESAVALEKLSVNTEGRQQAREAALGVAGCELQGDLGGFDDLCLSFVLQEGVEALRGTTG